MTYVKPRTQWVIFHDSPFINCDFMYNGIPYNLFLGDISDEEFMERNKAIYLPNRNRGAVVRKGRKNSKYEIRCRSAISNLYERG